MSNLVPEVPPPDGSAGPPAPRVHHDVLHGRDLPLADADRARVDAKHRLAAEARRLVEAVALLDPSDVDDTAVAALADEVGQAADAVERHPSLLLHGGAATGPSLASALDERSPVSGQSNPIAPPMDVEFDGERTRASATYGLAYEGPPFHVHGGWVIAAFDELLGVAQVAAGQIGMTGTISVRLRRPTPVGKRIEYEAWVDRVEGRKTCTKGVARCDGEVLAEAEGVFVAPRNWLEAIGKASDAG